MANHRAPAFIVKRCEFIEIKRIMYGSVASYGPWRTLGRYPTLEVARARRDQETQGLFKAAVFYKGRMVVDPSGRTWVPA